MTLSSQATEALCLPQTAEAFIYLLEISHEDLPNTIRVCGPDVSKDELEGVKGVYSGGEFYVNYPFELKLPSDTEDSPPKAKLKVENVSRDHMEAIRSITTAPTITLYVVLLSQPDTIERGPIEMLLTDVTYDLFTIEGTLAQEAILDEAFPYQSFTPFTCPGIF